jgi:hypothetical protein
MVALGAGLTVAAIAAWQRYQQYQVERAMLAIALLELVKGKEGLDEWVARVEAEGDRRDSEVPSYED